MTSTPTPTRIPIRKLFWDAFEIALETQTHRLAKDIATVLGKDETPLLKALKSEKVGVYLFEDAADEEVEDIGAPVCTHAIQEGAFQRPCGAPIVWTARGAPTNTCLSHSLYPNPLKSDLPIATPLAEKENIFLFQEKIVNQKGECVGRQTDTKICIFEVVGTC